MSDFTVCPNAFGRGEKKLYKEHIVQWHAILLYSSTLDIIPTYILDSDKVLKKHSSFVVFPIVLSISVMLQKSFWSIRSKLLKVLPILAMILVVATILITTVVLEQVIMTMKDMIMVTMVTIMMTMMMLQVAREESGSGAEEFVCAAADKSCLERCHYQPSPQNISIKGAINCLLKITRNTSINKAITSEKTH